MTTTPRRIFLGAITLVVVATIAASLWVAGSPREARLRAFDERRVEELSIIEGMIGAHWSSRNTLPSTLDALSQASMGAAVPKDPETGGPYEYRVIDEHHYEICATFARPSEAGGAYYGRAHAAGRQCYTEELRDRGR